MNDNVNVRMAEDGAGRSPCRFRQNFARRLTAT